MFTQDYPMGILFGRFEGSVCICFAFNWVKINYPEPGFMPSFMNPTVRNKALLSSNNNKITNFFCLMLF